MIEFTYSDESDAKLRRRQIIQRGFQVSLIAYDFDRDVYAFDVYS